MSWDCTQGMQGCLGAMWPVVLWRGQVLDSRGALLAGPGDSVLGLTTGALASHVKCSAQTLVRVAALSANILAPCGDH